MEEQKGIWVTREKIDRGGWGGRVLGIRNARVGDG